MREIELWTSDGHFVAVVEIGPFPDHGMPKVVSWGDRIFVANDMGQTDVPRWAYNECFATVSFTPSPGKPRIEPGSGQKVLEALHREVSAKQFPPVDRSARIVLGNAIAPGVADTTTQESGQQKGYVALSAAERAKGFVRPVRRTYKHEKCGATTTMSVPLAETYARDPAFYSGTFCTTCKAHFPVGADGELVWAGTSEKVGT